jgi:hypothetical protein
MDLITRLEASKRLQWLQDHADRSGSVGTVEIRDIEAA